MKLVRFGPAGKEKPGLIDADGKLRDLSKKVKDIDGAALAPAKPEGAREARPEEAAARQRQAEARRVRRDAVEVRRDRPQFHRPRQGNRLADSRASGRVLQGAELHRRAQRQRDGPEGLDAARLGSRARHRDRQHGALREREGRDEIRRRLLPRQRRIRARVPVEEGREPVEQGQGLRHVRAARAVARHEGRDQGRAEPRHVARRQRRAPADRQHEDDDLRRRGGRRRRFAGT